MLREPFHDSIHVLDQSLGKDLLLLPPNYVVGDSVDAVEDVIGVKLSGVAIAPAAAPAPAASADAAALPAS